jgi:glutamate/tyrosine decarboxylase-like PLP-dependent enzyme
MGFKAIFESSLRGMNPRLASWLFKPVKAIPFVRKKIQKEYDGVMKDLEGVVKPYKDRTFSFSRIPEKGRAKEDIIREMEALNAMEESKWKKGFASGAVYHGDEEHIDFLNQVYALNSQSNPLHSDLWPSTVKYEAEVVSMTASMLGAGENGESGPGGKICGTVTSGGTESILLAMKTYRDWAKAQKGITRPEMIVPVTAHAAFDKAAQYFNIKMVRIPIDQDYKADVAAAEKALSKRTMVIVGSAPSFPHGIMDPIEDLSEIARHSGVGFHTDACLGGFVLPWAEKLGYPIARFDFRLPGVTSVSVDTHKYGYASKGTSVILYRGLGLRHYQYYKTTEWPGGLYFSPTFAGSRPGALSAACWAAMTRIGQDGYLSAVRRILETGAKMRKGIQEIPDLYVLGDPLWVIAFGSRTLDIYKVLDYMSRKTWSLNGLHKPPCLHICITLRHTQPGVAERFVEDLKSAVEYVKDHPGAKGGMAPVYGMAATLPDRDIVGDLLERYIDLLFEA